MPEPTLHHTALTLLAAALAWLPARGADADTDIMAAAPDTSATALREIVVSGRRGADPAIPAQVLDGQQLRRLNSHNVADALRYFSGVQIKDYGGVGGIKTVNIRSMGSNHTGVVYDGVQLGNAQNGQIDLGQFSLDNIEALSLHNGQKSDILQPARDFGNAGSVYMRTRTPQFAEGERWHGRFAVRAGSFDVFNPSALVELRLSERVSASVSAEWLTSSGRYRFRYRGFTPSGAVAYDTTAVRRNGDIDALRAEINLHGTSARVTWRAKAYNYTSHRGVPGAIVNNVWRRGERIGDCNTFVQGSATVTSGRWTMLNTAKYAFYRTHYVNNDEKTVRVDNIYRQHELYISTANRFEVNDHIDVSASYDLMWNALEADVYNFARPDRVTNMLSVAAAGSWDRFKVQAAGLGTWVKDRVAGRSGSADRLAFTPSVYLSGRPLRNPDLSLRAFYKRSFRMPTFNDLYYADMGNSVLSPERVTQYNAGVAYEHGLGGVLSAVRLSADAYYNTVRDKIVAYPRGQQFRWTMLNLGRVAIRGVDVSALLILDPVRDLQVTLRGQYTYQRAIDVTDPKDSYYRNQIPYIPRHSASGVVNATWRQWGLNASYIYVGERYNQQENTRYNHMGAWRTCDLSLSRDFTFGRVGMRALVEVNNVLNDDYQVILNYPMPKRNFRFTVVVRL